MSTRCRIGIMDEDGAVVSIYCHHDGYPSHVGRMLRDHYGDEPKVRRLMELGDVSSLGTEPVANPNAWADQDLFDPKKNWFEEFKRLHPENMCDAYSTRGENVPAIRHANEDEFVKDTFGCWGEYAYLFKGGEWLVYGAYDKETGNQFGWVAVGDALKKEKEDE